MATIVTDQNRVYTGTNKAENIVSEWMQQWSDGGNSGVFYGYVTINAAGGNDTVQNNTYKALVNGDAGNDYLENRSWQSTISGGAGNDTIYSHNVRYFMSYNSLSGGEGNDVIIDHGGINGGTTTINGGVGDDSINVTGASRARIQYADGDGNDVIQGYYDVDTIQITSGQVSSVYAEGDDVIIKVGEGQMTVKDGAGKIINILGSNGGLTRAAYTAAGSPVIRSSTGTSGDDYIYLTGSNVNASAGAGNDHVVVNTSFNGRSSVNGGTGNDTIVASGSATINYAEGDGDDVIYGFRNYNSVISLLNITNGTPGEFSVDGNDYILQIGSGSVRFKDALQDGLNNFIRVRYKDETGTFRTYDYVAADAKSFDSGRNSTNNQDSANIPGTNFNDTITNHGENATISTGEGDDTVFNYGKNALIDGGDGSDLVINWGEGSTVNGSDGDDHLRSDADNALINGGAGNDYIYDQASNATLNGDAGNDQIFINNVGANNTTVNNVIANGGAGADTIENYSTNATLNGDAGNDYIYNYSTGTNSAINGGAGTDYIYNAAAGAIVNGGDAADTVSNSGNNAQINGGAGDDYIANTGDNVVIDAGAGSDTISNSGKNDTIIGGTGNDEIILNSDSQNNVIKYTAGDGADVVYNFSMTDTINIEGATSVSGNEVDNDYVIHVSNQRSSGTITLKDAANYKFIIDKNGVSIDTTPSSDYDFENTYSTEELSNSENNKKFYGENYDKFGEDLESGDGPFNLVMDNTGEDVTMKGDVGNDTLTGSDTYGDLFLFDYLGGNDVITNFGVNDTLKIGSGNIASTIFNGNDLVVTVTLDDMQTGMITLKDAAQYKDILKLNNKTFTVDGINKIIETRDDTQINGEDGRDYIISTGENVIINGRGGDDTIYGSDEYGDVFRVGALDGNDLIKNFSGADTLQVSSGNIESFTTFGKDVLVSIKQGSSSVVVTLEGAAEDEDGNPVEFIQDGNKLTIDQTSLIRNSKDGVVVSGTKQKDVIVNSGQNVTIESGNGNDTITGSNFGDVFAFAQNNGTNVITNFDENDTLRATSGTISAVKKSGSNYVVTIKQGTKSSTVTLKDTGSKKLDYAIGGTTLKIKTQSIIYEDSNTVNGTSGDDSIVSTGNKATIDPGTGNDTITGSDAYGDLFRFGYTSGDNVITNFGAKDTLYATNGTLSYSVSGNDVVATIASGTIASGTRKATVTLQGAAAFDFNQANRKLTLDTVEQIINDNDAVKVTTTSGKDMVVNNGANVTISGSKGNDTVVASVFNELFSFGTSQGENVIMNFGAGDTLRNTSSKAMSMAKDDADVVVTIGSGSSATKVRIIDGASLDLKQSGKNITVDSIYTIENDDRTKITGTSGRDYITNNVERATIAPGAGNDTIEASEYREVFSFAYNNGANLIKDFARNDSIYASSGTITGAKSGDDYIVTISGGTGGKTKSTVTIEGAGDYTFEKSGKFFRVKNGNALDLDNAEDGKNLAGTDDDDYIGNTGQNVTIDGKGGNDTISGSDTYGEVFVINQLSGNDVITNFGAGDTLKVTGGTVKSEKASGSNYIITVSDGTNTSAVTLQGANGLVGKKGDRTFVADAPATINNTADDTKLDGTEFADRIINVGSKVTINPGDGNDTIYGSDDGQVYQLGSDSGYNLIKNFNENDTIQISAGWLDSSVKSGEDVVFKFKSGIFAGDVTLEGAGQYAFTPSSDGSLITVDNVNYKHNSKSSTVFSGTSKADYITNSGEHVTIRALGGNDTIEGSNFGEVFSFAYNHGKNVITNFGANDTLYASSGTMTTKKSGDDMLVTIKQGTKSSTVTLKGLGKTKFTNANRKLTVTGPKIIDDSEGGKITGSTGDDYITSTGPKATIAPGKGNDTIIGSDTYGDIFQFGYTGGSNLITNFGDNDTLQALNGTLSYATSGNDVVATIKSGTKSATVTLAGAADKYLIQNGRKLTVDTVTEIDNQFDNTVVSGSKSKEYIVNSGENVTIKPGAGNDTVEGSVFSEFYAFSYNQGNNVITDFGLNDTIVATSGNMSYKKSGSDMIVTITNSSGKNPTTITLQDAGSLSLTQGKKGSAKTLYVAGINEIVNHDDGTKVTGKSGADYIVNTGANCTLVGAGGADTIVGSDSYAEVYSVAYNTGKDVLMNFGTNDTLKVTSGKVSKINKSGNDYVLTVASTGSSKTTSTVTFKDAALGGEVYKVNDKTVRYRSSKNSSSAELAPSIDDYWFTDDTTTDVVASNDLDSIVEAKGSTTALAESNGDSYFTSVDGSAQLDQSLATYAARHKEQK